MKKKNQTQTDSVEDAMDALTSLAEMRRLEKEAEDAINKVIIQEFLMKNYTDKAKLASKVFFTQLVLASRYVPCWTIPTMCTDGKTVRYNPKFTSMLSPAEVAAVLAHEALHPGMGHQSRRSSRSPYKWNVAADCEINPILREAGFKLPAGGVFPGERPTAADLQEILKRSGKVELNEALIDAVAALDPKDQLAERYYDRLPDMPEDAQGGSSDGADPGACGGVEDAGDEAAQANSKAEWQKTMAQAAALASKRGTLPGELTRFVERALDSKVDWRDALREFLVRSLADRDDYSWSRPSRRYAAQGIYLPSLVGEALAEFVVHVDTSGSTAPYLEAFAGELSGVLELAPCKVTIVYCDAAVQRVEEWRPGDGPLEFRPDGGGGTSHRPVWEWLAQAECDPVAVISLTDNETDHGEDPGVPVLWAIPEGHRQEVPFGRAVKISDY